MPFFQILELGNTYMYANALHLSICKFILESTSFKMLKNTRLENPYKQKKFKKGVFCDKSSILLYNTAQFINFKRWLKNSIKPIWQVFFKHHLDDY